MLLRSLVLLVLACQSFAAVGQSADQQIVSAIDSPDPVVPGNNLTYTVTVTNNGPDPATNGGLNANLDGALLFQSAMGPAGFTCASFGNAVSCTNPAFAVGTAVFTVVAQVPASLLNFPDGTVTSSFSTSGVTPDPNSGNNNANAVTTVDSPQIDLSVSAVDSPDPVFPDGNITYTVDVTNAGPDTASNVNFNVFNSGTLQFQSATVPAGFTCTLPAVGGNPTFTCTTPSMAPGSVIFTVVLRADSAVLGINDGIVQTVFSANGTGDDTNDGNNIETESTAYVAPDADLQVSASDNPDPVFPDGDITYTITVGNNGPDAASDAQLNVPLNNTLRFQSLVIPAGWSCPGLPAPGGGTSFSCSHPSFASGGSDVFTLVLRAGAAEFGSSDQTLMQTFTVGSAVADPNNGNNSVVVSTQYLAPDADLAVTASGAPPSLAPGDDVTYSIGVQNNGPDSAGGATLSVALDPRLRFQSLSAAAGFSCSTPAVGANGSISCSSVGAFATGPAASFTLVAQLDPAQLGAGVITQVFNVAGSGSADPVPANDTAQVLTGFAALAADLSVGKSTTATSAVPGATLTYTLVVDNNGPDAAAGVTLTDVLQANLGFVSITAPAGFSCLTPAVGASGTITCTAATLANGATATFTLQASVVAGATGTITNSADVSSATADPDTTDNNATTAPLPVTPDADLRLSKTLTSAATAAPGATVSYSLLLSNDGPATANTVVLTDVLPGGLNFLSITAPAGFSCSTPAVGAAGTITCSAASLANAATASFSLQATVAPSASGSISNSASASSATTDPDGSDNSATSAPFTVVLDADLRLAKALASSNSAAPGSTVDYILTVVNDGPASATNVVVTDVLPAGLAFLSATPSQGSCSGSSTITCTLGTLINGASATISLSATVTVGSGSIVNTANVAGGANDPDGGDNAASAPAVVVQGAAVVAPILVPVDSPGMRLALALLLLILAQRWFARAGR